jgi:hypothetical protein
MTVSVFLSYRHSDAALVRPVQTELKYRLPAGSVVRDLDSFQPGGRVSEMVADAIRNATVVLAMIGPTWFGPVDERGVPGLHRNDDWVRYELATALATGRRVIPVLAGAMSMPGAQHLPPDLRPLGDRLAVPVRDGDWQHDIDRLLETIEPGSSRRASSHAAPVPSIDAGPIAGGDVTIIGGTVAGGRDVVYGSPDGGGKRRRRWRG